MKLIVLNVQEQLERRYAHGLASDASREHLKQQGEAQAAQSSGRRANAPCRAFA